ncbi:DapH/DapD/GlmU-related protein [Brassicibacter mesophilus]|uniref:acyltransferase n=1 Tax=Brassicibacter mesophilus TaxID=745119 RepID=UPI003D22C9D9
MNNYKRYPNVIIGCNCEIGDFVIIGEPPRGKKTGDLKTVIGDNAIIRSNTIIYSGNTIGDNFQCGHNVTIRENNAIGNNVSIGTSSCIEHHIVIEDNVRIHSQAFIPEYSTLKNDCWIGPNVVLTNARYPKSKSTKENLKGPTIESGAIIGANSTILPGIKVENNAIIGAGSVVTRDVPEKIVVAGNPAKKINEVNNIIVYEEE